MFHSVWLLSLYTAFKPLAMSFVEPAVAVAAALAIVALSRPCARLLAHVLRRLDGRWRRRGRPTLLRPRNVVAAAALIAFAALYAAWRMAARYRLGPIDTSLLHVPA